MSGRRVPKPPVPKPPVPKPPAEMAAVEPDPPVVPPPIVPGPPSVVARAADEEPAAPLPSGSTDEEVRSLVEGRHTNPHQVLGLHGNVVRAW
ncbi:MAG: hypothetical protein QOI99_503, partial [Actinomycetota bacterium]|nr:hypothetical protein [Actinomycetota bacterium]